MAQRDDPEDLTVAPGSSHHDDEPGQRDWDAETYDRISDALQAVRSSESRLRAAMPDSKADARTHVKIRVLN